MTKIIFIFTFVATLFGCSTTPKQLDFDPSSLPSDAKVALQFDFTNSQNENLLYLSASSIASGFPVCEETAVFSKHCFGPNNSVKMPIATKL